MSHIFCPQCRLEQPAAHTYCASCGERLPTHLLGHGSAKKVRLFPGVKVQEDDLDTGFLRVTCYLKHQHFSSPEGSITFTGRHVRFSVWDGEAARCVLSIPETEARALAEFIFEETFLAPAEVGRGAATTGPA